MTAQNMKIYEIGDKLSVHYLTGTPLQGTVIKRFKVTGRSYKGAKEYYPNLQKGEYAYSVADDSGDYRNFTRFDIIGKIDPVTGQIDPNPDYIDRSEPTRKAPSVNVNLDGFSFP